MKNGLPGLQGLNEMMILIFHVCNLQPPTPMKPPGAHSSASEPAL